ncbi:hypothetical protein GCM10010168_06140 [Actinoplanes ianthinogenes]|uniref:Pyrrolo-quinoline quinone repeat domain-containing protein n=1 Tax=Actinoplanes ianthinogenes TaxID=122358 RepID=A0ABN6CAV3_9ACTN|nr:PQQ-binding-like beta-propeller repeat protein [Actinoplanes ianthinogenes]BCJ42644.1 hypothetical protein Aiant_33010 [Actinoplanes ianthinogenes]GGQ93215.1 hypothetical protein GCM10010168_06140 [Actinoplanes ianthinogenes]
MTMIDLGDVSGPGAPEAPVAPLRFRWRAVSRAAVAVLAVLCAVGLTGSARPGPPRVHELWSMPLRDGGYPNYVDDQAVLFQVDPGGASLTAYDLGTGRVRWTTPTGPEATWVIPGEAAHRLYVAGHSRSLEKGDYSVPYATDTLALDSRTGAVRWRHAGQMMTGDATTALLADRDDQARITALHLVRAADGAPVWDRVVDPAQALIIPEDLDAPDRVVTVSAAGALTTFRYTDGTPLAGRRIAPLTDPEWSAVLLDGRLVLMRFGAAPAVTAYRTDTLDVLWNLPGLSPDLNPSPCGPVLCVGTGMVMHALDPETGKSVWEIPQLGASPINDHLLLTSAPGANSSMLVEATTGRPRTGKIDGTVLGLPRDDGTLLVLRPYGYPVMRTAIVELDPETGRTRALGSTPYIGGNCQPVGRYLVCVDSVDQLRVTAVG